MKNYTVIITLLVVLMSTAPACTQNTKANSAPILLTGADQLNMYYDLVKGKNIALTVNLTSTADGSHLVDFLSENGVRIKKIFSPEHGFRGTADAGATIKDGKDTKTGLPIISLYGENKKPTPKNLEGIDVVIFDIQDVGARFYTYISTMHYVMEACAENNIKVLVLDRPNPNGDEVNGPVLDMKYKSFVGMHPIPIVHGMTVGEIATMINGEGWLKGRIKCDLEVIKLFEWTHNTAYSPPIAPSPNLPNAGSVQLYPSLCLFEGTTISVGRGTSFPFQVAGGPDKAYGEFTFTPVSTPGAANPKHKDKLCYGVDFRNSEIENGFSLAPLIDFYQKSPDKASFFTAYFNTLAGNSVLRKQIENGMSEKEIRKTWQQDLTAFKKIRKKYLLYDDFE